MHSGNQTNLLLYRKCHETEKERERERDLGAKSDDWLTIDRSLQDETGFPCSPPRNCLSFICYESPVESRAATNHYICLFEFLHCVGVEWKKKKRKDEGGGERERER